MIIALIPVRYQSSRLPGKQLLKFDNEKIIRMTREGVRSKKVEISMVFLLKDYRSKGCVFQMLNNFIESVYLMLNI